MARLVGWTNRFLFLAALLFAANSWAQTPPPWIGAQIAKTYGVDSFGQIEALRYTFNAQLGALNLSRSWVWEPKTGKISYEGKDKDGKPVKVTYIQSQLASQPANIKDEIDPAFVNDQYNLLFPLHVYWDGGVDVKDLGMQKLPLGGGSARRIVVKYPPNGGYNPGDTWELYLGPDNRVVEFVYHRGGLKKPSEVVATWAGYKKAGPLLIATDRRGNADGKPVHIFFTDVAVKLTGSDTWMKAK